MDSQYLQRNSSIQLSQSQRQNIVETSHLPDEKDIEKLFPKCQLKQRLAQTSNNNYSNQSNPQFSGRQNRFQQQHSVQQKRRKIRSLRGQHYPRKDIEVRRGRTSETSKPPEPYQQQLRSQQRSHDPHGARYYKSRYFSPDSSDEPNSRNGSTKDFANLRRSATSSEIFERPSNKASNTTDALTKTNSSQDIDSKGVQNSTSFRSGAAQDSNRNPRSRIGKKFSTSKNQPLSRNQSVRPVISTSPAPLINLSSTEVNDCDQDDLDNSPQQQDPTASRRSPAANQKQELVSKATDEDCPSARKMERGVSRTNRGVVFLDRSIESEFSQSAIPKLISSDKEQGAAKIRTSNLGNSVGDEADDVLSSAFERTQIIEHSPLKQRQNPVYETSAATEQLTLEEGLNNHNDSILGSIQNHNQLDIVQNPSDQKVLEQPTESRDLQNDDDKYINLFVYDNCPQLDKDQSGDKNKPAINSRFEPVDCSVTNVAQETNVIALQHHDSNQLLDADQSSNESDLVRNDTSTEELCNLDESTVEMRRKLHNNKLDEVSTSQSHRRTVAADIDKINASSMKFLLKHHRSLGTLQTVDEKAEINGESIDCEVEGSTISRTDLLDETSDESTQNKMDSSVVKKAFVPGFPQRVRSQLNNNGVPCQSPKASSTGDRFHMGTRPTLLDSPTSDKSLDDARNETQVQTNPANHSTVQIHATCQSKEEPELLNSHSFTGEATSDLHENLENSLNPEIEKISVSDTKTSSPNNLRYQKLPNESSHFSLVRTTNRVEDSEQNKVSEPFRSSKVQFNTLSDDESDCDVKREAPYRHSSSTKTRNESLRSDISVSMNKGNLSFNSAEPTKSSTSASRDHIVFPKLDEGLSSEPESCGDDMDDDDDRAMEADVDANDDDDEDDEEIDDDIDSPVSADRTSSSIQSNQFSRHRVSKHASRAFNNYQPPSVPNKLASQHAKNTLPSYGNLMVGNETLDQTDIKSQSNFSGHNGQSNYWMNGQQTTLPQSSSSNQFHSQKGHQSMVNGNNSTRGVDMMNRDDGKANRLSSDTDNETDRLLGSQRNDQLQKMSNTESNNSTIDNPPSTKQTSNSKEILIEGVLFNVKYLGSTHTECEGRGEKEDRINQAEMAVHEVKFRSGENSTQIEVQLFISTEKIMVLDDKHRKIMMDHSLRTISYIADIGNAIVLIVRKKSSIADSSNELVRPIPKTTCHVFESHESHTITKSISQAFQVAYTELLRANGGDTNSYLPKELDYQEVLNSQEMSMTELEMFARKDNQREVIVPKQKGEILGLSIVESGWGSVLPTAVIASLKQDGPAYRCKKLSVGDQILSINGISLVGLSLSECQEILRKTRNQRVARLSIVPCPITVEVKIKRPDTKYQLGFSVQNGVICSLLRGGIAERGGVRVGHRIMSINGTTVVGVPHDKIVTLLASSVGEIRMKTCLTSLYRHMLGEEKAVFL